MQDIITIFSEIIAIVSCLGTGYFYKLYVDGKTLMIQTQIVYAELKSGNITQEDIQKEIADIDIINSDIHTLIEIERRIVK